MATSGNFLTSDSGQGGGNFYGRMIFEWWQVNSGISGSVGYHGINYHLKTYGGSSSYYQYFYNGSMNVDGSGIHGVLPLLTVTVLQCSVTTVRPYTPTLAVTVHSVRLLRVVFTITPSTPLVLVHGLLTTLTYGVALTTSPSLHHLLTNHLTSS